MKDEVISHSLTLPVKTKEGPRMEKGVTIPT